LIKFKDTFATSKFIAIDKVRHLNLCNQKKSFLKLPITISAPKPNPKYFWELPSLYKLYLTEISELNINLIR
tara:strand:+ start:146 stop:361 length:216 start_codon:yes stop_codon:yes gene_type:complete